MDAAERLPVPDDRLDDVLEIFERRSHEGLTYRCLPEARHGLERGTVLVGDAVVRGYPSVPRTMVVDPGVPRYFDGPVAVEEKLDGYNVRVARVADRPLAFTRSGYVCPYTTARVREALAPAAFFEEHPERMLCAELVGPETPYTDHDYDDVDTNDVRVFDVRDRTTGDPLPVDERRALCDRHGFAQPTLFGTYDPGAAADALPGIVADLADEGREGVVMKSADGERLLKYTTGVQNRDDLAYAFSLPFEYGRDYVFSRVVREAFQSVEFDDDRERRERARELGEALLLPMVETVEAVADGERVGEEHTVRGDPAVLDALLEFLDGQHLTVVVLADREEDGERVLTFRKVARSTTDTVDHYLSGGTVTE